MRAVRRNTLAAAVVAGLCLVTSGAIAAPKVVIISLDGAKPELIERFIRTGVLPRDGGLATLKRRGIVAEQNITATPSVTAVSHIAIATGSTAVHNDIPGNTFHPVAASIATSLSGFAAPIGGYQLSPIGPSAAPTAEPLWVQLRNAGRKVATATWPGSDGADIRVAGTLVQGATPTRITDYTVPFGAFGGLGAQGFTKSAADFGAAPDALVAQLIAAGVTMYGEVKVTNLPVETVFCAPATSSTCGTTDAFGRTLKYEIKAAALDSTNDGVANYDTLVFFEATAGIASGPFALPDTGPAYAKLGGPSARFFFDGSGNKVGTAYFVSHLAPDLSTVRFARYGANYIPRNAPVLGVVDDVNAHVGFWAPQPDFRIPERISPGFTAFPDLELEAMYEDQVATFTDYQTRVGLRAIEQNPDADLAMIYLEQPDGSGHQFTLTDWRQPTDFADARTIGWPGFPPGAVGRDWHKVARYAKYLRFAYQTADEAVLRIMRAVGMQKNGEPRSDVFVVSDHGMAPFHTAVNLAALLTAAGVDTSRLGIRTTGPATNIYVNLAGREAGGTVSAAEYETLVSQVAGVLREAADPNAYYNPLQRKLFSHVWTRPFDCGDPNPGLCTSDDIGQDSGDIVALMVEGYNFDGTQAPQAVMRLGDESAVPFSVPNFYGAHGHDSNLPSMSAILYAAGPSLKNGKEVRVVRNIDIAPTIMRILGVTPAATVDGKVIPGILERGGRGDE
jgi:predicted AlkP superfamily pyrophosphatase or phosphodiesterase